MSKDLLLEIGTEEIPARFMPGILEQIAAAAKIKFAELRVGYTAVRTLGTPRRMTLIVTGMAETQTDRSSENKGPSVKVAFDAAGAPTKAGAGFARGQKVDVRDLVVKNGYVYALVHETGRDVSALLAEVLPELIHGLTFPKNMHWADLDMKFVRPIKWIVALFGQQVIPFCIAGVQSGHLSRGHRFLGQGAITLRDASSYETQLEEQFVIADPDVRRAMICAQIEELAAAKGGRADITEELLEEVVYLVEYPTALCGGFEEKYLSLPPEAVVTPMREHQRYFPVLSAEGQLMPLFITVRNGSAEHIEIVQRGNERVLRARLADAQFFFEEDCKVRLIDRLDQLKSVVFQEGLGSIYDQSIRLGKLAAWLSESVGTEQSAAVIARAAALAKADLVTGMVCEFTELQGVMGRAYALLGGESQAVAAAIYEHYLPRFAGDALPESPAGRVIGIADKLDTIVATFSRGLIPTGSQDPYALRRQALGIVNILIDAKYRVSLTELIRESMDLLELTDVAQREKITISVQEFFRLRLKGILADQGIRYDVIDAALSGTLDDLYLTYLKAQAVAGEIVKPAMIKAVQSFVRVGNLAKKAAAAAIDASLFQAEAEEKLYRAYVVADRAAAGFISGCDYAGAIGALVDLTEPIDVFFEQVMVMDQDAAVQSNRLGLLKSISDLVAKVADFSKIV